VAGRSAADDGEGAAAFSQTLDRGLRVLEVLSDAAGPLSVAEISAAIGLHRSVTYRLVRTLEHHRLVERDAAGSYAPGVGLAGLARSVRRTLQAAALPELTVVANRLRMTSFLVVRDGAEAVTIASVEPRATGAHVAYQPGTRHPVDRGAPGLALLMPEVPVPGERDALAQARERGWAQSESEVIAGLRSVAVPVLGADRRAAASLAVVFIETPVAPSDLAAELTAAAGRISVLLS
jgi:DNA-binding IclR family transcriptional regulator